MTEQNAPWGRVDETGTVYVREESGERAVGQYPDGSPEEALAYFERKYAELAGQVTLLEQRARRGAPAADVAKTVAALSETLREPNAVGDIAALRGRIEALGGTVTELTEKQTEENRAAVQTAIAERTELVVEAERIAAQDPAKVQWKQTTAQLDDLFAQWKKHQADAPRIPKGEANELWKRFRAARTVVDTNRRAFFAELDSTHRDARTAKQALVERAEALASQGSAGIPTYRRLLDEWKASGRAGKKVDDALWAKFKAAGDVLYSAKSEQDAVDNVEFGANLEAKQALLAEAEPLLKATDRIAAREKLTSIQRRWDEIGKVPRDQVRTVEDRLRQIETAVRKLDEEHWNTNNPERQERQDGFASMVADAIAKLESELEAAKAKGDPRAIQKAEEALAARKAWLGAVQG